jgi:2,3-bisphosphoglycerate-dependent phosphoglycerate mutase
MAIEVVPPASGVPPKGRGVACVFETHSWSVDNELGLASGWRDSPLSQRGRSSAVELGERRREDGIQVVFSSDLARAVDTARIAFSNSSLPILCDWRLRECNYGEWNGAPVRQVHGSRGAYLDQPYPGGESWRQAVERVGRILEDLRKDWDGARVLIIGHQATRWACEHFIRGIPLEELARTEFVWQPGWEYHLT